MNAATKTARLSTQDEFLVMAGGIFLWATAHTAITSLQQKEYTSLRAVNQQEASRFKQETEKGKLKPTTVGFANGSAEQSFQRYEYVGMLN